MLTSSEPAVTRLAEIVFTQQYGPLEPQWTPEQWHTLRAMFAAGARWRDEALQQYKQALSQNAPWHHYFHEAPAPDEAL